MEKTESIIDDFFLGRKLTGVWEMERDSSDSVPDGYALSFEGYFVEIELMLDVSGISIACFQIKMETPHDESTDYDYQSVSNKPPFSRFFGKTLVEARLLTDYRGNWAGVLLNFDGDMGLCIVSANFTLSALVLEG